MQGQIRPGDGLSLFLWKPYARTITVNVKDVVVHFSSRAKARRGDFLSFNPNDADSRDATAGTLAIPYDRNKPKTEVSSSVQFHFLSLPSSCSFVIFLAFSYHSSPFFSFFLTFSCRLFIRHLKHMCAGFILSIATGL